MYIYIYIYISEPNGYPFATVQTAFFFFPVAGELAPEDEVSMTPPGTATAWCSKHAKRLVILCHSESYNGIE